MTEILAQLEGQDLGTVRVEGVGDSFNEAWVGIVYGMDQDGVDFLTRDGRRGIKWGDDHVWRKDRSESTAPSRSPRRPRTPTSIRSSSARTRPASAASPSSTT